jgi:hypothetical protein
MNAVHQLRDLQKVKSGERPISDECAKEPERFSVVAANQL